MIAILPQFHHCDCGMCEWLNFGTFLKFPCIVRIYAWFFMHCRNHHSDSHANHVITLIPAWISNYTNYKVWDEIAYYRWMPQTLTNEKLKLVTYGSGMALRCQTTYHYLSECWSSIVSSYGVTKPQWVSWFFPKLEWPQHCRRWNQWHFLALNIKLNASYFHWNYEVSWTYWGLAFAISVNKA